MKTPLILKVATRAQTGRSASRRLRKVNRIPAILYGKHSDPEKLSVEVPEFTRLLKSVAGRALLIELNRDDKAEKALSFLQEIQRDPITDRYLHVDLHEVKPDEKFEIRVPVRVTGESFGVKNQSGVLEIASHVLRVRCLAEGPSRGRSRSTSPRSMSARRSRSASSSPCRASCSSTTRASRSSPASSRSPRSSRRSPSPQRARRGRRGARRRGCRRRRARGRRQGRRRRGRKGRRPRGRQEGRRPRRGQEARAPPAPRPRPQPPGPSPPRPRRSSILPTGGHAAGRSLSHVHLARRRPGKPGPRIRAHPPQPGLGRRRRVRVEARPRLEGRPGVRVGGRPRGTSVPAATLWLVKPQTFMNESGRAVAALARYHRIARRGRSPPSTTTSRSTSAS